ncbi:MAG: hypothetical protein IJ932_02590 [Ruminococcus sp.]|nr:hypothetical protein [Ruminococcus sp.]
MKKRFNLKNLIGKKNLLLTIVALVLVMLMVVGVSYSWIEQISNVEMTFGDKNHAPMLISTEKLNKPAESKIHNGTAQTIDLSKYFYESGNMHLSSCYSDGKTFYFPKRKSQPSSGYSYEIPNYRLGTKDDANVNYISVTFKLRNTENYEQAYWFDKNSTFFASKSNASSTLDKLIRMSMTVDGSTSIFSASDTPTYKTVSGISASAATTDATDNDCQSFKAYQYDAAHNRQNDSDNDNRSKTRGANGNTLFVLPAGTTSTITIKVWLEYDGVNKSTSLSDINLKLVSSFTQTRNIYLNDESVYNRLNANSTWMYTVGTSGHADMYLVLKGDTSKHWKFTETSANDHKHFVVQNFPSYYNNQDVYIIRCNSSGFGVGDSDKVIPNTSIRYYNMWETKLPDTYDDRAFTEYTPSFGSWRGSENIKYFYFIDSWGWGNNDNLNYNGVYAYMWDNNTVANNVNTVENHKWENGAHGEPMFYTNVNTPTTSHRVYVVYYDADFTHVIFNNNKTGNESQQTTNIPIQVGKFYDLTSDRWVSSYSAAAVDPYYEHVRMHGNWDQGGWYDKQMYRASDNDHVYYGTAWLKANKTYDFVIKDSINGDKTYKYIAGKKFYYNGNPTGDNFYGTFGDIVSSSFVDNIFRTVDIVDNGTGDLHIGTPNIDGIYTFRYDANSHSLAIDFPTAGSSSSGGSSSGGGSMAGYTQAVSNSYVKVNENDKAQIYTDGMGNFKATLHFDSAGTKYYIILIGSTNYGNGQSSQIYDTDPNFNGLYVSTNNNNAFGIRAPEAGDYVISFSYDNGNQNTFYISSIKKT